MALNDEKRIFLEKVPAGKYIVADLQKELHELLLRDTNEGKLYKYRSFNEKNIKCLKDGTLYCPERDQLNDPFDSKIGYNFSGLYYAAFGTLINRINTIIDKFGMVFRKNIALSECDDIEKKIIGKLLENKQLADFINENKSKVLTTEEKSKLLRDNSFVFNAFLELIKDIKDIKEFAPIYDVIMPKMMKLIGNLPDDDIIDYSSFDDALNGFASKFGIYEDLDEIDKMMQLTDYLMPEKANDIKASISFFREMGEEYLRLTNSLFRIGCLATDYKNRLMWSHYSDSHKGYCIEFDFSRDDSFVMNNPPLPVVYSEKRPLIPWAAALNKTPEEMAEASKQVMVGLLTKDKIWEYENEWRILIPAKDNPILRMPPITCIYLGASIEESDKTKILEIAREKGIPVKQMKIDRGTFELHKEDVKI